jgi:hypothetical protein
VERHTTRTGILLAVLAVAVLPSGCAAPIPREPVPAGWALDVHQPGEWWTQPLIPRSVVVQRCPPPPGWSSEPNLSIVTGVRPGTEVNYSSLADDYHCLIGWSEPATEVEFSQKEMATEAGLRRICSSSGLPLDESWRFVGRKEAERVGDLPGAGDVGLGIGRTTTVGFVDDYGTAVGCMVQYVDEAGGGASVELSVGADTAPTPGGAACPVVPRNMARDDDGTLLEYQLRGAGAVRGADGRILTDAKTLQLGVAGDSVTTSHPVVDGIAIVDAWVQPKGVVHFDWDRPPPVEGRVLGADGSVLATCHG